MLDFVSAPWPRYWTAFDIATNVIAYLPFGLLAGVAIARGVQTSVLRAAPWALLLAALLSYALESMQSLLPSRVPSRLDLVLNVAGAAVGIAVAGWLGHRRIERLPRALHDALTVAPGASFGALLLVSWPIAQWYPQSLVFATGDLLFAWPPPPGQVLPGWWTALILPAHYEPFIEACTVALAIIAVGSIAREAFAAPTAPRARPAAWPIALPIVAACVIKTIAGAAVLGTAHAFGWLSAAAQGGIVAGAIGLYALTPTSRRVRMACAVAAILIGTVLVNLAPPNAYYLSMRALWEGAWVNFHGLLRAVATLWPFAALAWCGRRLYARL